MPASGNPQSVGSRLHQSLLWQTAKELLVREAAQAAGFPPRDLRKGAVHRVVVGCMINDPENLPEIGRRVDRIVRTPGSATVYFDDGSWILASVEDPQPATAEEQQVVDQVYGKPAQSGCDCKHAHCKHAQQIVDMVAAIRDGALLRAMDVTKRGATEPRMWRYLVDGPFDLYLLKDVPLNQAMAFADFGVRGSRFRDGKQAWTAAKRHAESRPIQRVRA